MICWNWSLTQLQDILSLTSQIRKCFWPPPPPPPIPSPAQHTCTTDLKTHSNSSLNLGPGIPGYTTASWICILCVFHSHPRFVHNHNELKGTSESKESIWLAWLSTSVVGLGGEVELGGGFLAVNTWHGTQPGRLMVLTASAQWLGIRGCNWVEPKYGHSRQLLIAGANHTLPSLPRFQLFATSGKDTWISYALEKLLWDFALDYLSCVLRGSLRN